MAFSTFKIDAPTASNSPEQTRAIARELAARLAPGAVLALRGPLGAGKTCFVQGLARGLGVAENVTSPTFTLIREYKGRIPLCHVDLYRMAGNAPESPDLLLEEILRPEAVTAIEWPEIVADILPAGAIRVSFAHGDSERQRIVTVRGGVYGNNNRKEGVYARG